MKRRRRTKGNGHKGGEHEGVGHKGGTFLKGWNKGISHDIHYNMDTRVEPNTFLNDELVIKLSHNTIWFQLLFISIIYFYTL